MENQVFQCSTRYLFRYITVGDPDIAARRTDLFHVLNSLMWDDFVKFMEVSWIELEESWND